MTMYRPLLLLAIAVLALGGCATRNSALTYNPTDFSQPDPAPPAFNAAEYKLSPGDVITVKVYELDDISGDQTVDTTGRINFPLIGTISADGRTTEQFAQDLTAKLGQDYIRSPHVTVSLKTAAQRIITVDGAVDQPGIYPMPGNLTLIQAVALARGTSADANPKRVVIFRQIDGVKKAAAFDLTTIRTGKDPDPKLYPQDLVVVDGSSLGARYRDVLKSIPCSIL